MGLIVVVLAIFCSRRKSVGRPSGQGRGQISDACSMHSRQPVGASRPNARVAALVVRRCESVPTRRRLRARRARTVRAIGYTIPNCVRCRWLRRHVCYGLISRILKASIAHPTLPHTAPRPCPLFVMRARKPSLMQFPHIAHRLVQRQSEFRRRPRFLRPDASRIPSVFHGCKHVGSDTVFCPRNRSSM